MEMTSMKRTKADKKKMQDTSSTPIGYGESEDVPYGLHVRLDHESMKKLGLHKGKMPKTGSKMKLHAIAHVHSTSDSTRDGESERSMELHLHHMGIAPHTETDDDAKQGAKAAMDKALEDGDE